MVQTVQISNEWVHSHLISYRRQKTDKEPFERFERFEPWAIIIKLVWSFERFERFERLTQEKCDKYNAITSVISSLLIYLHSFDLIPYPTWRQLNPKWLTQAGIKYFQMRSQVGSHPLVPLSPSHNTRSSYSAIDIRETLCTYVNRPGALPWQTNHVRNTGEKNW